MLSVSILGIKDNLFENIQKLDKLNIDFFHVDIMDGIFVKNKTWQYDDIKDYLSVEKKIDIHLMVNNVEEYVNQFKNLKPNNITYHYEAVKDNLKIINLIKSSGIKVGISIKPDTPVSEIKHLLKYVDLVLVMSVEPGLGGQKFIENSTNKINELYEIRKNNNYNYLIEVDGGINDVTKEKVKKADIIVVGSFITNSDYEEQIKKLSMN